MKNNITWSFITPLTNQKYIEEYEKHTSFKFDKDFIEIINLYNEGYPSKNTFDTKSEKGYNFNHLLSFNKEDSLNVWVYYDDFQNENNDYWIDENLRNKDVKNLIPFACDSFGNLICFEKYSKNVVFWNHERNKIEIVSDTFDDFLYSLYDEKDLVNKNNEKLDLILKSLINILTLEFCIPDEINKYEKELSLTFSEEYKFYLLNYGQILADGVELTGKSFGNHVVSITKREKEYNPNVHNNLYVIEDTGIDGIIIWQDDNGFVFKTVFDSYPSKIANSLYEYLYLYNGNTDEFVINYIVNNFNKTNKVAENMLLKFQRYEDIYFEFLFYVINNKHKKEKPLLVKGYSSQMIENKLGKTLNVLGIFNYLIYLRENPNEAINNLEKGLKIKDYKTLYY